MEPVARSVQQRSEVLPFKKRYTWLISQIRHFVEDK